MTGNSNPQKRLSDAERRHDKMREWLIDALAVATALLAVSHYRPDGMVASIIVFVGAGAVANILCRLLWMISGILLGLLTAMIYVSTLVMGLSSLPAMLLSALLPGIAQAYWIWALWPATGTLLHPLTLSCVAWLILAGITIFEQNLFANWRPARSNCK